MTKMTSLRIPDELHDEIKERAKKSLMLPSEYIRQILRNHTESTKQDIAPILNSKMGFEKNKQKLA